MCRLPGGYFDLQTFGVASCQIAQVLENVNVWDRKEFYWSVVLIESITGDADDLHLHHHKLHRGLSIP